MSGPSLRNASVIDIGKGSTAAGASSLVITMPVGVQNNDFLLMVVGESLATLVTPATPSGWSPLTPASQVVGTTAQLGSYYFYRWASSEPASYTLTLTAARYAGLILAARNIDSVAWLDVAGQTGSSTTTEAAHTAITPVTPGSIVLGVENGNAASGVTNTTYTSTNLTIPANGQVSSTGAATVNTAIAMGYLTTPWTSGAVTPVLTPSGTIARGVALSLVLRPQQNQRSMSSWR